jgi:group I intron endonuclease
MAKPDTKRKRYFHCYKITCTINGKVYIGIASNGAKRRFIQHKHDAKKGATTPLHAAMRKYGIDNFTIEVLGKTTDWDEACQFERDMILKFNSLTQNGHGYNVSTGGEGPFGVRRSEETRQKLRKITKGWLAEDPDRLRHLIEVGKKQAAEPAQKEISRRGAKDAWKRPGYRKKVSERVTKWAKENKALMSANQMQVMARPGMRENLRKKAKVQMKDPKNRELSRIGALKQWENEEFREKMFHQMKQVSKRNWKDPEYRKKMKKVNSKPIIANGEYYSSLEDAAKAFGVKANTICTRLKNPNFPQYYYLPPQRYLLINDIKYPSFNAAAKSLGISNAVCKRRIENKDFPEYILVEGQENPIDSLNKKSK